MREFAAVQGLDDRDRQSAALVRAFFANLVIGLSEGHILQRSAEHVMDVLYNSVLDYLEINGDPTRPANDFSEVHVDMLEVMLIGLMQQDLDSSHFSTRGGPITANGDAQAITLQPHWAFKFWLKGLDGIDNRDVTPDEVIGYCEDFLTGRERFEDAAIGKRHNVVWMTPYVDEVRTLVEDSLSLPADIRQGQAYARRLREMLGLIDRLPGEQAVLIWTRKNLDQMSRERRVKLSAPTILDSRGYRRFRHWPNGRDPTVVSNGYGRTYELERAVRVVASPNHGAPELVRRQLLPPEVSRFEYVGKIQGMVGEGQTDFDIEAAWDYADEISHGMRTAELLDALEGLFGTGGP